MAEKKYYKLGANATNFWDPTQPRGTKNNIVNQQVMALIETPRLTIALRNGWLVLSDKKEHDAHWKEARAHVKGAVDAKTITDANNKVKDANVAARKAKENEVAATEKAEDLDVENAGLKAQLEEATAKLEAATKATDQKP